MIIYIYISIYVFKKATMTVKSHVEKADIHYYAFFQIIEDTVSVITLRISKTYKNFDKFKVRYLKWKFNFDHKVEIL